MTLVYMSNLAPDWPFERQRQFLDRRLPNWRSGAVYTDNLVIRRYRHHIRPQLLNRDKILQSDLPTTLCVCALPVLAWDTPDFIALIARLNESKLSLVSLETGLRVGAAADDVIKTAAILEFRASRKASAGAAAPRIAASVVSANRRTKVIEGCNRVKDRWGWPTDKLMAQRWGFPDHPYASTLDLQAEAGGEDGVMSYSTMVGELGARKVVQQRFLDELLKSSRRRHG